MLLQLLWDLSRDVAFKRAEFLATQAAASPAASSVLVTDVPGLSWGTPLNRVSVSCTGRGGGGEGGLVAESGSRGQGGRGGGATALSGCAG
jgi:hypothetical protein